MDVEDFDKNWVAIFNHLPDKWKELSIEYKALSVGKYIFTDPEVLMKAMFCYLMAGASFDTVADRLISQGFVKSVSGVAVLKKFRRCAPYFKALSAMMIQERVARHTSNQTFPWVIRAFDGTHITTPGDKTKDIRLHMSLDVLNGVMDYVEYTDIHGGETLKRLPVKNGELILADGGYGNRGGAASIIEQGADVIVRINGKGFPCKGIDDVEFDFVNKFNDMPDGSFRGHDVIFYDGKNKYNGRLCAYKKTEEEKKKSIEKAEKTAKRKGSDPLSEYSKFTNGYVFVFTSLSDEEMNCKDVLDFYRLRWQIEIYFKKLKSQLKIGTPPSRSQESLDAWVHGKILATLLIEGFAEDAKPFSPS